ncbi:hypothetical protein AB0J38_01805 [Streptomyces sp. NPDC050095]|uniref:hypothetical protein n=1 Tax=unclassified Streptomyces TaxID=2593676 RepID=UPI00342C4F13
MTNLPLRGVSHGPKRAVGRLKRWLRGYSADRQFFLGLAVGFPPVIVQLASSRAGLPFAAELALLAASSTGCGVCLWLMRPWFESLSSAEQRRITALPVIGYIGLGSLFVLCTMLLAFSARWESSVLLIAVWVVHSVFGATFEPSSAAYERLRGRLGRAAPMRLAANWFGILGLLLALSYAWERPEYKGATLSVAASIVVAGAVASLRVLARVRRLRTRLDEDAADIIQKLETLRQTSGGERVAQEAAEAAWEKLRRTLGSKIDTGITFSGVTVLPHPTLRELHHAIHRDIRTSGADRRAHRQVLARLRMLRLACAGRMDVLA